MNRGYRSALRDEQTVATRQRIVDALVEQAAETGRRDFSIADVAQRAGVAERTVYRYFPTREDLLNAVNAQLDKEAHRLQPRSEEDLTHHIRELFAWFEQNAQLVEASHVAGLGQAVRSQGRQQRGAEARKLIDEWLSDLPESERQRTFAVFRSMFGSVTWRTMRQELGMSAQETVDAVEWILGLMMADLKKRRRELSNGSPKSTARKASKKTAKKTNKTTARKKTGKARRNQ